MKAYVATAVIALAGGFALLRGVAHHPSSPANAVAEAPAASAPAPAPEAPTYVPLDTAPPEVPSAPPSRSAAFEERAAHIIANVGLEPDLWTTYTAMTPDALATAMKDVRASYDGKKERTDALTLARKEAIEAGDYTRAQKLLDEMAPMFEERHRLSSQLMVAALAKAARHLEM